MVGEDIWKGGGEVCREKPSRNHFETNREVRQEGRRRRWMQCELTLKLLVERSSKGYWGKIEKNSWEEDQEERI